MHLQDNYIPWFVGKTISDRTKDRPLALKHLRIMHKSFGSRKSFESFRLKKCRKSQQRLILPEGDYWRSKALLHVPIGVLPILDIRWDLNIQSYFNNYFKDLGTIPKSLKIVNCFIFLIFCLNIIICVPVYWSKFALR